MAADLITIGPFTPTIDINVYADGDRLGSVITITTIAQANGGQWCIVGGRLHDDAASNFTIECWLFGASPTMVNADNGVFDITDANIATAVPKGVLDFQAAHTKLVSTSSRITPASFMGAPPLLYGKCESATTSIYGIFKARGAYDAAATDDLNLWLDVIRYS